VIARASHPHWIKREAEAAARAWQAQHGGTLKAACAAVLAGARFPGLQASTLLNYVRRSGNAK